MNVGIVGIGFMGMIHYLAYDQVRGAKVTAIATRDAKKLAGDWRAIKGNFGPPGTRMNLGKVARYRDWKELLADPKVDLVDICLPPDLHADVAVAAFRAGKHVLCEKPIALSIAEADRMVRAADKAGKLLLVGQVLPYFPEYAYAYKLIAGGKYGRMIGGHFKRVIAEPSWLKDFFNPAKVGGPVIDLSIHDAHFIRMACGMPQAVFSTGRLRGDVVEFIDTQFLFEGHDLSVSMSGGVIKQLGRSFSHGFEIYLEKATLCYDFSVVRDEPTAATPLTVLLPGGKVQQPKLTAGDAFAAELTDVAKSVRSGKPAPALAASAARDALALCHKQTQSVLRGRTVRT